MPTWAITWGLRLLPYISAAAALGLAVWYLEHQGYERAKHETELRDAKDALARKELKDYIDQKTRDLSTALQDRLTQVDASVAKRLNDLNVEEKTIVQPTLIKEIASDPRFSDPNLGITDGMRNAINTARSASGRPCPSRSDRVACIEMSPGQPTP